MTVDQRIAGRFAIASGIVTIVAAIVLVTFFLVEAHALVESGDVDRITVFGSTNDALIAVALLLLGPVALFVAPLPAPDASPGRAVRSSLGRRQGRTQRT